MSTKLDLLNKSRLDSPSRIRTFPLSVCAQKSLLISHFPIYFFCVCRLLVFSEPHFVTASNSGDKNKQHKQKKKWFHDSKNGMRIRTAYKRTIPRMNMKHHIRKLGNYFVWGFFFLSIELPRRAFFH